MKMSKSLEYFREDLQLNCGHFVVSDHLVEPIHGHSYKISVEIYGDPLEGYDVLVDFLDLKPIFKAWELEFNLKTFIPTKNPRLNLKISDQSIKCTHSTKFYEFPSSSVILLPIENTTVEYISGYLLDRLVKALPQNYNNLSKLKLKVGEYFWSSAASERSYLGK